ncbi:hypothetical protein B566_EDAN016812 [Ephemera danica]|nr:hypothetical protein B566_EDAN016812 [Ephemera danica]
MVYTCITRGPSKPLHPQPHGRPLQTCERAATAPAFVTSKLKKERSASGVASFSDFPSSPSSSRRNNKDSGKLVPPSARLRALPPLAQLVDLTIFHMSSRDGATSTARSAPHPGSPVLSREKLRLSLDSDISRHARLPLSGAPGTSSSSTSPSEFKASSAWETLVLFAVNFTRLNVHMNMGNDFKSEGRLSIGSTGHKNMYIGVGLGGSSLDAKGGIVGGTIELSRIDTFDWTTWAPECSWPGSATSTSPSGMSGKCTTPHTTTSLPAGWDQLQVMISKSTTADLLKMFYKLDEFFSQQFKSSKRVFSSLQTTKRPPSFRRKTQRKTSKSSATEATLQDARHHRHWHRALNLVAGLHLSTLTQALPSFGSVLGGTMELHGNNISLACFHGINFKSKSWALFSLREPCISFATEAQEVPDTKKQQRKAFDPAEMFLKDWRNFHCKTWHLEPTVRLLSWAGKSIEPYGVDYILQKLGFAHARTTIPKWMQRGFMDPLDKVLSLLMLRMIVLVREDSRSQARNTSLLGD